MGSMTTPPSLSTSYAFLTASVLPNSNALKVIVCHCRRWIMLISYGCGVSDTARIGSLPTDNSQCSYSVCASFFISKVTFAKSSAICLNRFQTVHDIYLCIAFHIRSPHIFLCTRVASCRPGMGCANIACIKGRCTVSVRFHFAHLKVLDFRSQ